MAQRKIQPGFMPVIPTCLYCGREKDNIIQLRYEDNKHDELKRHRAIDSQPCEKCQEVWQQGVTLVKAQTGFDSNMLAINNNGETIYLDGSVLVLTEDAGQRILGPTVKKGQIIYLEKDLFKKLYEQWQRVKAKSEET